jgi:hypothetical protein
MDGSGGQTDPPCLLPRIAICEACPALDAYRLLDPLDPNSAICGGLANDSFWFLTGKNATHLAACCAAIAPGQTIADDCEGIAAAADEESVTSFPLAVQYSCLYNHVANCMGVYDVYPNPLPISYNFGSFNSFPTEAVPP